VCPGVSSTRPTIEPIVTMSPSRTVTSMFWIFDASLRGAMTRQRCFFFSSAMPPV
jgi:hypothetical protein